MERLDDKSPKYVQIEEFFRSRIMKSELGFGEKLLSENEISEKFGVSRHTVRQALLHLEKEKLIQREQGRGAFVCYRKNERSTKSIAVMTTYISNYIFPPIISGIEEILSQAGYTLSLFNTCNDKGKEREYLERILEGNFEGMIMEPTTSALENNNVELFHELADKGVKQIMINACYRDMDAAHVVMDDEAGGYLVAKYLYQIGHRRIAGIFKSDDEQGNKRRLGYENALCELGAGADPELTGSFTTADAGYMPYEFAAKLLRQADRPTAIQCYNDEVAMQVLQAARDLDIKVPEELSVVGFDDSDIASNAAVRLTTVKHPKEEMGRRAARYLISMIEEAESKPYHVYKPELIVRDSAAAPPPQR